MSEPFRVADSGADVSGPRTAGSGRRFELVVMRLRPPTPRTEGLIAKHASSNSYHWVLVTGRQHAVPEKLGRLLAVAYLDEASGMLGRGDPRWAVPRAYLRSGGSLETTDRPRWDDPPLAEEVLLELERIAAWLEAAQLPYLERLRAGITTSPPPVGFERLTAEEARQRGVSDPTGRALLAPDPPPVVTRTASRPLSSTTGSDRLEEAWERLPWSRFSASR